VCRVLVVKHEGMRRDCQKDLDTDGRITLRWVFDKHDRGVASSSSGQGPVNTVMYFRVP
jgi:hypothetical protein